MNETNGKLWCKKNPDREHHKQFNLLVACTPQGYGLNPQGRRHKRSIGAYGFYVNRDRKESLE